MPLSPRSLRRLRSHWLRASPRLTPPAASAPSRWSVVNQPIVLWFLTSVVLGAATFFVTNYSTCRSAEVADSERLILLAAELNGRVQQLQSEGYFAEKPNLDTAIDNFMDPSRGFVFTEFKGRTIVDLTLYLGLTLARWDFVSRKISGDEIESIKDDASKFYYSHFYQKPIDKEHVYLFYWASRSLESELMTMARHYKAAVGENRVNLEDNLRQTLMKAANAASETAAMAYRGLLFPRECARRGAWPF